MEQAILNALSPEYLWRDRVHYLPEGDSTNDRLKILAAQGAPHGTSVITDHQTGGHIGIDIQDGVQQHPADQQREQIPHLPEYAPAPGVPSCQSYAPDLRRGRCHV